MKLGNLLALGALAAGAAYLLKKKKKDGTVIQTKGRIVDDAVDQDFAVDMPAVREVVIATNNTS